MEVKEGGAGGKRGPREQDWRIRPFLAKAVPIRLGATAKQTKSDSSICRERENLHYAGSALVWTHLYGSNSSAGADTGHESHYWTTAHQTLLPLCIGGRERPYVPGHHLLGKRERNEAVVAAASRDGFL